MYAEQKNVVAICPSRIDFTGGFTDVLPFRATQWVSHVSLAIDLPIEVSVTSRSDNFISIKPARHLERVLFSNRNDIDTKYSLIKTALEKFNISGGVDILIDSRAPHGAGLGTSGALSASLVAAFLLFTNQSLPEEKTQLAVLAADLERDAGTLGGLQDQFAAISGGLNRFGFYGEEYTAKHIELSNAHIKAFEEHILILHPGGERHSTDLVENVMNEYKNGNKEVIEALGSLDYLSEHIIEVLTSLQWDDLSLLMRQIREQQLRLNTDLIDSGSRKLISYLGDNGVKGIKLLGGGGSGACLLAVVQNNEARMIIENICTTTGVQVIPFRCAMKGLSVQVKDGIQNMSYEK